ncbi:MAG: acryloyl-CoA reductase, partial [Acidimicrobiales bacterium]|nr:acryloyl-CoA reductase [Acidimicrobiales bacterium]
YMKSRLRAIIRTSEEDIPASLTDVPFSELPEGDILIESTHASLNYKDALAILGTRPVIRKFPMVCGVDVAGVVKESSCQDIGVGDRVLVTGEGLGEDRFGGLSELVRVDAKSVVHIPPSLTNSDAMAIGTAGLTAALCVIALEKFGLFDEASEFPILVSGASGGVGSFAVVLLAKKGVDITAVSGKKDSLNYLIDLGATQVIDRSDVFAKSTGYLATARYRGAIDVVGGEMLGEILRQIKPYGAVAACGLTGGGELMTSLYPFIIRNVALIGVESIRTPHELRVKAWERLANDIDRSILAKTTSTIGLDEVVDVVPKFLNGEIQGRLVVEIESQ